MVNLDRRIEHRPNFTNDLGQVERPMRGSDASECAFGCAITARSISTTSCWVCPDFNDVAAVQLAPAVCDGRGCVYNLLSGLADFGVALLVGVTQAERSG
jgi:hypothetical protein